VSWPDLLRFVQALLELLSDRSDRFERRMRKGLTLVNLCRKARFETVQGARLHEFLKIVGTSLEDEVPVDPTSLAAPTWVGRVLFRQALALYPRKDQGPDRSLVRSRFGLMRMAWRFARGKGAVPRLHGWIPVTSFERAEDAAGRLSSAAEEVLERYYRVKVGSLQFCGPAYFGFPFWEGFEALALTLPVIFWLRRVFRDLPDDEAIVRATGMVDRNYAFNRLLGMLRQRFALRLLTRRGELSKLIAWYSR
jgi:lysine-N-methylase